MSLTSWLPRMSRKLWGHREGKEARQQHTELYFLWYEYFMWIYQTALLVNLVRVFIHTHQVHNRIRKYLPLLKKEIFLRVHKTEAGQRCAHYRQFLWREISKSSNVRGDKQSSKRLPRMVAKCGVGYGRFRGQWQHLHVTNQSMATTAAANVARIAGKKHTQNWCLCVRRVDWGFGVRFGGFCWAAEGQLFGERGGGFRSVGVDSPAQVLVFKIYRF